MVGRDGHNLDLAHLRRLARGQLDHALEAARFSHAPAPRGTISGTHADRAQRGQVEMVAVQMGDEDGVDPLRHIGRRRGGVPTQVQESVAQDRVGEQPHAVELDQNGRVSDERQAIVRQRITPFG